MKTLILIAFLVGVVIVQGQRTEAPPVKTTAPIRQPTVVPPYDATNNSNSDCGTNSDNRCINGFCIEQRLSDGAAYRCTQRPEEGEQCMVTTTFINGDNVMKRIIATDSDQRIPTRTAGQGARGRETSRTINGVEDIPCSSGNTCRDTTCVNETETMCTMAKVRNNMTRCTDNGMFEPLQCRRSSTDRRVYCMCVHALNGSVIANTTRPFISREKLPDCYVRSFQPCDYTSDNRRVSLRQNEFDLRRQEGVCKKCTCNDGMLTCSNPDNNEGCSRSDPDENRPRNCMKEDGTEIMHKTSVKDGQCNTCGCRNGQLQCTKVACTDKDSSEDEDSSSEEDRKAEACRMCGDMPREPLCLPDGRTIHSRCHAMMCQDFSQDEPVDGSCSERNYCDDNTCSGGSECMQLGGQTQMSRDNRPDDRILCVNRMALRCSPTDVINGTRKIVQDTDSDSVNDDGDRTLCATDGNTYPSTCHMIVETRNPTIPEVMHTNSCRPRDENKTVCGTDGMTYSNMGSLQTRGGNIRMDYMGNCMRPESGNAAENTVNNICRMVTENGICSDMSNCSVRVKPSDSCCPICGGAVNIAMDQEKIEEYNRATGELRYIDDMTDNMFREGPNGMPPVVPSNSTDRCIVTMTRPVTIRGNVTEVTFEAKNMTRDGEYCHKKAMEMVKTLNTNMEAVAAVSIEQTFIAAAASFPALIDGTPVLTGSCVMVIMALLMTLFL